MDAGGRFPQSRISLRSVASGVWSRRRPYIPLSWKIRALLYSGILSFRADRNRNRACRRLVFRQGLAASLLGLFWISNEFQRLYLLVDCIGLCSSRNGLGLLCSATPEKTLVEISSPASAIPSDYFHRCFYLRLCRSPDFPKYGKRSDLLNITNAGKTLLQ